MPSTISTSEGPPEGEVDGGEEEEEGGDGAVHGEEGHVEAAEVDGGDEPVLVEQEQCDNGENNSDELADACRTNCQTASCGDGVLDTGEQCDDGNNIPGDLCDATCNLEAYCGDGNLDSGETCDDGNTSNNDTCLNDCSAASCGDGFQWIGNEDCDGTDLGGQECTDVGFAGGTLACTGGCTFDTSSSET